MIKIGILCKELDKLRNFELRIIDHITNDPQLDLSILIFDGRKQNQRSSYIKKFFIHFKRGGLISKVILRLQEIIEGYFFKVKHLENKSRIVKNLNKVNKIYISPERKGFLDIFNDKDSAKVSNYNLDLILRFEFDIIRGPILESAKHGIWSFHHGDNQVNRGGPSCFWEIVLGQDVIGTTLQRLTPELDGGKIIDKAYYNRSWSLIKSRNTVLESSVILLIKNFNILKNSSLVNYKLSKTYSHKLYKSPNLYYVFYYIISFYVIVLKKLVRKLSSLFLNKKFGSWSIAISKGNFQNIILHKLKILNPPKNEFWADPFIFSFNKKRFIFFENFEYDKSKGKISCGYIVNNKLIEIKDVLDKDYHLSYPFIFNSDDDIFMIPETHKNNQLEIYKCRSFPDSWELYSTAFKGEQIVDCNFYDDGKNKWLMMNKRNKNTDGCSDLYIYKIDSLKLNNILSHKKNPVLTDSRVARNAGPIFEDNGNWIRPSQINTDGYYGRGINLNKIIKLSLEEYEEQTVESTIPNFHHNIQGMHHIHQVDNLFVTDFCFIKK